MNDRQLSLLLTGHDVEASRFSEDPAEGNRRHLIFAACCSSLQQGRRLLRNEKNKCPCSSQCWNYLDAVPEKEKYLPWETHILAIKRFTPVIKVTSATWRVFQQKTPQYSKGACQCVMLHTEAQFLYRIKFCTMKLISSSLIGRACTCNWVSLSKDIRTMFPKNVSPGSRHSDSFLNDDGRINQGVFPSICLINVFL